MDHSRLEYFGINDDELINWWNLKCKEVIKIGIDLFMVKLEEAGENSCPTLCRYLEEYLKSFGWKCQVEAEW